MSRESDQIQQQIQSNPEYSGTPGLGRHYLAWLEYGGGGVTWYGTAGLSQIQSGIIGTIED